MLVDVRTLNYTPYLIYIKALFFYSSLSLSSKLKENALVL